MGCYVNPCAQSKTEFLVKEGVQVRSENAQITETHLPVCLVDNGAFMAAGVAFNERELKEFQRPDGRNKVWFQVPREKLRTVSDLASYER